MEKLDNCNTCHGILNQVEYDHQFCNLCGWGLGKNYKLSDLAFALAYADYLHSDDNDMPEKMRVELATKHQEKYLDKARTVMRRLELRDVILITA